MACNKESDAVIDDGGERCVAGGARGAVGARIAIASESKQAGATPRRGRSNHITPGLTPAGPLPAPAPHTSFECASLWRRPGPCMILVRVRLISDRLDLTRHCHAREIKTGSGPEGAIDPRFYGSPGLHSHRPALSHRTSTSELDHVCLLLLQKIR